MWARLSKLRTSAYPAVSSAFTFSETFAEFPWRGSSNPGPHVLLDELHMGAGIYVKANGAYGHASTVSLPLP